MPKNKILQEDSNAEIQGIKKAKNYRILNKNFKITSDFKSVIIDNQNYNIPDYFNADMVIPTIDTARQLILKLEEYKSVIKNSAESRQVYTICRYVQELASEFHSFYNANRVISDDKEMMKARIALVWSVKNVLHNALEDILAVTAPERM